MKVLAALTVACLILISGSQAHSQYINLFADQAMTQCSFADNTQNLRPIYVFWNGPPATGLRFSAPRPACWQGATWIVDSFPGPRGAIGNSQSGMYLSLFEPGIPECKTQALVCTIYFTTTSGALPCCEMTIAAAPSPFEPYPIEYFDCFSGAHPANAGTKLTINANPSCPCGGPVATEPTTWGRVKSLYR